VYSTAEIETNLLPPTVIVAQLPTPSPDERTLKFTRKVETRVLREQSAVSAHNAIIFVIVSV
jgi:hypothetical protein